MSQHDKRRIDERQFTASGVVIEQPRFNVAVGTSTNTFQTVTMPNGERVLVMDRGVFDRAIQAAKNERKKP